MRSRQASPGRRWPDDDGNAPTVPSAAIRSGSKPLSWACGAAGCRTATLGPVTVTAQVYDPGHVTAAIGGPFRATDGRIAVDGSWQDLRASVRIRGDGLQRHR